MRQTIPHRMPTRYFKSLGEIIIIIFIIIAVIITIISSSSGSGSGSGSHCCYRRRRHLCIRR